MVQVVQHQQPDIGHGVRLLRNRGRDHALLNPLQRVRVGIHCDNGAAFDVVIGQHSGHFFSRQSLQAYKSVDVFFLVVCQELVRVIECNARVALDIDDVGKLNLSALNRILVSVKALIAVRLRRHSQNNDRTLTFEFLYQSLAAG
jgi:hypothetical protein